MAIITINNVSMPEPSKLQVTISDISSDSAGRNAAGDMLIDRVAEKRKVSVSWNFMAMQDAMLLLQAVDPIYFDVTYPDPKTGNNTTKTFYVSDRTVPIYSVINNVPGWQGVSMDFLEK